MTSVSSTDTTTRCSAAGASRPLAAAALAIAGSALAVGAIHIDHVVRRNGGGAGGSGGTRVVGRGADAGTVGGDLVLLFAGVGLTTYSGAPMRADADRLARGDRAAQR